MAVRVRARFSRIIRYRSRDPVLSSTVYVADANPATYSGRSLSAREGPTPLGPGRSRCSNRADPPVPVSDHRVAVCLAVSGLASHAVFCTRLEESPRGVSSWLKVRRLD